MGNIPGRVLNVISKPFRDYNIENRAIKVISKDKPSPAPKYTSTVKEMERIVKDNPNIMNEIKNKDEKLNERLRNVFVTSTKETKIEINESEKNLPTQRKPIEVFEFGYEEPEHVPAGKITLKQAIEFLNNHQTQPSIHTAERIAQDYNLNLNVTNNILKHYRLFKVFIQPENKKIPTLKQVVSTNMAKSFEEIKQKIDERDKANELNKKKLESK